MRGSICSVPWPSRSAAPFVTLCFKAWKINSPGCCPDPPMESCIWIMEGVGSEKSGLIRGGCCVASNTYVLSPRGLAGDCRGAWCQGAGQTPSFLKQDDYSFVCSFIHSFIQPTDFFLRSYYMGHYTLGTGDLVPVFLAFRSNMPLYITLILLVT